METISGMPLTKAFLVILGLVLSGTEGRPGTNFAGSSMTSDDSGTRSSHLVGSFPDSNSVDPNTRIYTSPNGGTTVLSRNGGTTILTGTGGSTYGQSGGGPTVLSTRNGGAAVLTGTSSNGGGVGVYSRTGPTGGGSQYSVSVPYQPQPSILGRFGQYQPSSGYSGYSGTGMGYGGVGTGAYAGAGGASSGAYAGPGGASAGAYAGPVNTGYDYYG